jgi:hypothetical protein
MTRPAMLAAACLLLAACTTTTVKSAAGLPTAPLEKTRVLIAQPDIELSVLTAPGLLEPRADWAASARANMQAAVEATLKDRSHRVTALDPATAMEGREGQVLRLQGAVGASILAHGLYGAGLPSKTGFDWTLGEGARLLAVRYSSDYALFIHGRGSFSSGGRVAMVIGAAALGVSLPMGGAGSVRLARRVADRKGRLVQPGRGRPDGRHAFAGRREASDRGSSERPAAVTRRSVLGAVEASLRKINEGAPS